MRDNEFEWDDRKAASNLRQHSVSFDLARLVFADPLAIDDVDEDTPEDRSRRVGMAADVVRWLSLRCAESASASSPPERQASVTRTVASGKARDFEKRRPIRDKYGMTAADWARLESMTDEEVVAAANSDPDAQPLTDEQLSRMRRISLAKHVRCKLRMSQTEFADAFHIPIGTLRDWEQHRCEPDQAARAYLTVIARNPTAVRKALQRAA